MIDNHLHKLERPVYATRRAAIAADGMIYLHVKGGGIYRFLGEVQHSGDDPKWDGVPHALFEHLWPHNHEFYVRPMFEFIGVTVTHGREHRRFLFLTNASCTFTEEELDASPAA